MTDYDRWLEQPYQEAAERDDAIEQLVEQVLEEEEFDPTNVETFFEAINDGCLEPLADKLQAALKDPNVGHAALGKVIYDAVYEYCYDRAEKEAAERYNSGLGGRDEDDGDF